MADTAVINLPGSFMAWFEETGVMSGTEDADDVCEAARLAVQAGRQRKAGKGYYIAVTATAPVLRLLSEYGENCLTANSDEPDPAEVGAARKVIDRATQALASLGA